MAPLSAFCYLTRNLRTVAPVLTVIALAVLGVSLTAALTGSMIASARLTWVKPYEKYALVAATEGPLDPEFLDALRTDSRVSRVVPAETATIKVYGIFGSEPRPVLVLGRDDLTWFIRRLGLEVVSGRLPEPGRREIALHEDIARSRQLRIGMSVGQELNADDFLPGRHVVVGLLSGPYVLGLAASARVDRIRSVLVFPRPGQERALERQLAALPRENKTVTTYASQEKRFAREVSNLDAMIWILNLISMGALSLSVGLLNLVFFVQRMAEFGILAALGYSRLHLIRRTSAELSLLVAIGWLWGLSLAYVLLAALERYLYLPRGIHLAGLDARVLAFTLPVPAMTFSFSLTAICWRLTSLDPVSVVERRE